MEINAQDTSLIRARDEEEALAIAGDGTDPFKPLENPAEERFAQLCARGDITQTDAAIKVWPHLAKNRPYAWSLSSTKATKCAARISAIRQQIMESYELEERRIVQEIMAVGLSDIGQIIQWDGERLTIPNLELIPAEFRRAIKSIRAKTRTDKDGVQETELQIELYEKGKMLELMARIARLYGDQQANNQAVSVQIHMPGSPEQPIDTPLEPQKEPQIAPDEVVKTEDD